MPATRQKNSLLAVGRNLVLLPDKEPAVKRSRSLSEERKGDTAHAPAKLVRTQSESRASDKSGHSLFDLSEVCEQERQKLVTEDNSGHTTPDDDKQPTLMKPPTPGRPPSRKKHLLAKYYSDSALLPNSSPRPVVPSVTNSSGDHSVSVTRVTPDTNTGHNFTSPRPRTVSRQYSPAQISAVPQSPRNNYSPLHPSPLTKQPSVPATTEKQYTPLRSPVTPRDLRNSSILPPNSPQRSKLITCSPMGPVGRSLLSSPASPKAPIDLTMRSGGGGPIRTVVGRSPLASRSLNLQATTPETKQSLLQSSVNENTSPLLRAYLANNKNRIFKPIPQTTEEGVSVLPVEPCDTSVTLSPSTTISALSLTNSPVCSSSSTCSSLVSSPPPTTSPDSSTNSSSASELEGIFGGQPMTRPAVALAKISKKVETVDSSPLDFSGLISATPQSTTTPSPFSILSLTSPFLNNPRDLSTPHIELASTGSPALKPHLAPVKKYNEVGLLIKSRN